MKQRLLLILIIFACSFFCFFNINTKTTVNAQSQTEEEIILNNIDGIYDSNLYNALLWNNYNKFLPTDKRKAHITKDMFKSVQHLDLAGYEISSLIGLEKLEMPLLTSVNLSNNNISLLNEEVASFFINVTVLDLSNNNLKEINAITNIQKLNNLDASYNKISAIDLSLMQQENNIVKVNLMHNKIKNISSITLNNDLNYEINLISNFFTENISVANAKIDYFFQRSEIETPTDSFTIKNLGGNTYENFVIEVYSNNNKIETLNIMQQATLNVGAYTFKFLNNQSSLYNETNIKTYAFKDVSFNVIPSVPTATFYNNGKQIQFNPTAKNFGEITIKFNSENGYDIKVSLDGENYESQNQIVLNKIGKFTVYVKCQHNGVESKVVQYSGYINEKMAFPPIFIAILSIVLIAIIFFALKYYAYKPVNFNKKNEE